MFRLFYFARARATALLRFFLPFLAFFSFPFDSDKTHLLCPLCSLAAGTPAPLSRRGTVDVSDCHGSWKSSGVTVGGGKQ